MSYDKRAEKTLVGACGGLMRTITVMNIEQWSTRAALVHSRRRVDLIYF